MEEGRVGVPILQESDAGALSGDHALHQDRSWTAARLQRRGLQQHPRCLLCDQDFETMAQLLTACPFSCQIWYETLAWLRLPCQPPDGTSSLLEWSISSKLATTKPMHKGLASTTLLIPWMLWKQRKECVSTTPSPPLPPCFPGRGYAITLWPKGCSAIHLGCAFMYMLVPLYSPPRRIVTKLLSFQ
jgi:hypothetical protein